MTTKRPNLFKKSRHSTTSAKNKKSFLAKGNFKPGRRFSSASLNIQLRIYGTNGVENLGRNNLIIILCEKLSNERTETFYRKLLCVVYQIFSTGNIKQRFRKFLS